MAWFLLQVKSITIPVESYVNMYVYDSEILNYGLWIRHILSPTIINLEFTLCGRRKSVAEKNVFEVISQPGIDLLL